MGAGRRWRRSRRGSGSSKRRGGRRPRSAPTGWTCCGGCGSYGRPGWPGIGRRGPRPGLLPLAAGGGPTLPGPLASPGRSHRGAARRRFGQGLRAVGSCAQRDRAARLLRLRPRGGHRPDPEPVPPGPGPGQAPGARAPEPHGAAPQRAHGPLPAEVPARIPRSIQRGTVRRRDRDRVPTRLRRSPAMRVPRGTFTPPLPPRSPTGARPPPTPNHDRRRPGRPPRRRRRAPGRPPPRRR